MIPCIENIYAGKGLYQQMLSPLGKKYELTDSQLIILLYLADKNPVDTASKLVRCQRLKKSVVSSSIDDLEKRGFIESYYLDGDRRSKHLRVKDEAKVIINEAKKVQDALYALMTDSFTQDEKRIYDQIMRKVNLNMVRFPL